MYNDEGNMSVPFDTTNIAPSRLGCDLPQSRNHRRNTVDDRHRLKYQLSPPVRFPNVSEDPRFQRCTCRCIDSSCAHGLLAGFDHRSPSHKVCSRDPTLAGIQSPKRRVVNSQWKSDYAHRICKRRIDHPKPHHHISKLHSLLLCLTSKRKVIAVIRFV